MSTTEIENPVPALVLWTLHTDRTDRQYLNSADQLTDWLTDLGIDPDDMVTGSTWRIVLADDLVWLTSWQVNRDLQDNTEPCPFCQSCVRGHEQFTLLTTAMPGPVAALGWPDPEAPADWLGAVNTRAAEQAAARAKTGDAHA